MMIAEIPTSSGEMERFGVLFLFSVNNNNTYAALIQVDESDEPLAVDVILRLCLNCEDGSYNLLEIIDKEMYNEAIRSFNKLMNHF